MAQVGGIEIGIHPAGLELHPRHIQLFIGKLAARMFPDHLINGTIDLLAHGAGELLIGRRGQLFHTLLFQTRPELRLAPAFLAVPFVPRRQFPMKAAVLFPISFSRLAAERRM